MTRELSAGFPVSSAVYALAACECVFLGQGYKRKAEEYKEHVEYELRKDKEISSYFNESIEEFNLPHGSESLKENQK